ncbi:transposase of IS30 family protein [Spiroplasma melliferum]|uniref:Transposase of IS30 family protein n=1 Tax=Spiroplasma melliferum TaxID=2134 RepID=A0ABX5UDJ7_SPIME|nr:IS30 family transposase [Spiroplasma melliferum]QCO23819.1 transposase of IS30 family protein [Spiroplasma melliferum]
MNYKHFSIDERVILSQLLVSKLFQKKNGKPNLFKIAKYMERSVSTIWNEVKRFQKLKEYNPIKAHKKYLKNRKKSVKHIKFSYQQLMWLDEKFNKFHWSPEIICYEYNREFGIKFPVCFKTLYKYIFLGLFGLNKRNLYFHGRKNKSKQTIDNRGKLTSFRTIAEAKHDKNEFGWFEMDTIVGKDLKSVCLVLTEQLTKFEIVRKLKDRTPNEVIRVIKSIFKTSVLKKIVKGIITDQGKEFSEWRQIETYIGTKVYFCDKGKPTQKPIVERINRDLRHWFPKGIDLDVYSQEYYDEIVNIINERPRQCLGWNSAKKLFVNKIQNFI